MPRKLAAGNWKMNGLAASLDALHTLADRHVDASVDVLICPPATLLSAYMNLPISVGGQDCHANASGAHTGDISAEMLADAGQKQFLQAIQSGAQITAKPTPKSQQNLWRLTARACGRLSASAKRWASATQAQRLILSTGNWLDRCRIRPPRPTL